MARRFEFKVVAMTLRKSKTPGFPIGVCPIVGVGGHFSGGGYGFLVRRYGLAADNILDSHIIYENGKLLVMSEKQWVGIYFGPSEENATNLIHKRQLMANKLDENIAIYVVMQRVNSSKEGELTIQATLAHSNPRFLEV
ncbi:FAD-binding, type 2-like superfamily [Sesbania bispinosa]|nr:FAD-binding, type 2-like superfamily [Sesbania bispinosa]